MKIAVHIIIGLIFLGTLAAHADTVTIKEMLLSAFNDDAIKELDRTTKINTKGSYGGIPFIDDIELRMRNEAFDIYRMRYTLRIKPRGIGETKAGSRFNKMFSRSFERKLQFGKNEALRNRYIHILEQMEQRALEKNYLELIEVYEDMIKVMEKKQSNIDEFEFDKLIDGEDKNTKLHNEIYELKRWFFPSYNSIKNSLHAKGVSAFDTTGFVDIDTVIALVERNNFLFDTNNAYLDYYRSQYQLAEARFQLEKAEQRQYISLLAASYDNGEMLDQIDDRDRQNPYDTSSQFQLTLGIRIPDLTMARHDLARRKADYLNEKDDYEQIKRELMDQMNKDKEDLLSFIAQYRFLKARETEVDANSSLKKYLQMSGVDPLILLTIKESIVKNHVEIEKLKYRILRNYIQVMDYCGILSKPPLRNYLSREGGFAAIMATTINQSGTAKKKQFEMPSVLERFEAKYTIPCSMVDDISAFISPYCSLDKYSEKSPDLYYRINSLYFDTPDFLFLQRRIRKVEKRFNMRIRSYGDHPVLPYFFEIKHRRGDVIKKYRARTDDADLQGQLEAPLRSRFDDENYENFENRDLFARTAHRYNARPVVLVQYKRKAYYSECDDYARVTFDRGLKYQLQNEYCVLPCESEMTPCDAQTCFDGGCNTILELKCYTAYVPLWMIDLVRVFNLKRRSFSKYANCVRPAYTRFDCGGAFMRDPVIADAFLEDD